MENYYTCKNVADPGLINVHTQIHFVIILFTCIMQLHVLIFCVHQLLNLNGVPAYMIVFICVSCSKIVCMICKFCSHDDSCMLCI